jgi:hypothetical protein
MAFRPTRRIGAAFLGVFVIGAAVGALLVTTLQDMKLSTFLEHTSDPKKMADRINQKYVDQYHLTPEEQARIQPLTSAMAQRLSEVRNRFGVDIVTTLDDYHHRIGEQMTPEHREAYLKANEEHRKKMIRMLLPDPTTAPAEENK